MPENSDHNTSKSRVKATGIIIGVLFLIYVIVGVFSYSFPDFFTPEYDESVTGDATLSTLITLTDEMLSPWLVNDKIYPSIILDNPQNFQLGELEVVRYSVRVLRDNLSRLRTTDSIDPDANAAYTNFSNDPMRWILPSAESKYEAGLKNLIQFRERLATGKAHYYPRGDNLIELLNQLNSLLGGVCTRLSNIPNDFNAIVSEESAGEIDPRQKELVDLSVSWFDIDQQFYYAQGVAFALRQVMLAVQVDFKKILELKNANELVQNVILVLNKTQWEPKYMVMNCSPGSWIPCQNDPMMLNSRLQDTRQKISSIISMIQD